MKKGFYYIKGFLLSSFLRLSFAVGIFYLKNLLFITSEKLLNWWLFFVLLLSLIFPSLGYLLYKTKHSLKWLNTFQYIIDIFLAEALIMLTGGIESWFSFTLIIITISSAITLGKRGAMVIATLSSLLYGLLIDLQYYHVIKVPYSSSYTAKSFLYNIFLNISGIYLTAMLMRYMIRRLESTSEQLRKTDLDFKELSSLHSEVVENIPSGLFIADTQGKISFINRMGLKILNIPLDQCIGKSVNEIFPFLMPPFITGRVDGQVKKQDGTIQYIGMTLSYYKNSNDEIKGYIGTFQDVTAIVEMEQEMKRREKLSAIGELAASIAHEIRNPLASIKSSFEMLQQTELPEEARTKLMKIAIREMDRLNSIITDFLIYSRPKPPEKRHFCLSSIVKDILQTFMPSSQNIIVKTQIEDDIYIFADEEKVRQLLWNLLKNAKEAIEEKDTSTGEIKVILTRESSSKVKIIVSDNGAGMSEETIEKIFFPFFSTKEKGTGLGLSVVDRIVQEHNGKITVESTPDRGTAFTIILPLDSNDERKDSRS